jgi:large subunit ribosomal protein L16
MKPKNTKYKKSHRVKVKNVYNYKTNLIYSNYGLVALTPGIITGSQLESIILTIKRKLKRKGKIIQRVFPHQSVTKKPQEVRMGKGKGNIDHWQQVLKPNSIILELVFPSGIVAKEALSIAGKKLPFRTKVIV